MGYFDFWCLFFFFWGGGEAGCFLRGICLLWMVFLKSLSKNHWCENTPFLHLDCFFFKGHFLRIGIPWDENHHPNYHHLG